MQRSSLPPTSSKHKRIISIIVLSPGVKKMLLNDAKDFFKSEKWYADRGIPFRRGYLLHRVPGSGKSSLIHAIAGELMLDIYTLSLSPLWISDGTLTTLMSSVPARGVVFLEDLDVAFTRSTTPRLELHGQTRRRRNKDRDPRSVPHAPAGRREHCPPGAPAKPLDAAKLAFPAKEFADGCPDEFHVAALQGCNLLEDKSDPDAAASEVVAWVLGERELRERPAREKETREPKRTLEDSLHSCQFAYLRHAGAGSTLAMIVDLARR
ncbi:hypothetical protein FIBSPDRAFT_889049 [Athelia psychrophila]|uniref:ATPase AAA-type core domain-containing protein n=1 Tax=Athelia psychrophila TaxID=1759441 RepID=A0A166MK33_9AGAM|nr:hypothetical protein FIBSPDRAFT_889049 [Fibularhizoctonia sp. CBS 109695]